MCGIYGILLKHGNAKIKKMVLDASKLLKNRGYDSCGIYWGGDCVPP